MENIEKIKEQLESLNRLHGRTGRPEGLWLDRVFDGPEGSPWLVKMGEGLGSDPKIASTDETMEGKAQAQLLIRANEELPKLTDALSRVLKIGDGLESAAQAREREAARCRKVGKYDLADLHQKSAGRMRAVRRMLTEEISEAFGLDADNTQEEDENNGK